MNPFFKNNYKLVIQTIIYLLVFCWAQPAFSQDSKITSYPYSNDPLVWQDLKILDNAISSHNLIFTSEIHGHQGTLDIRKKFILYLSKMNKLDIVGLEADYAYGYEINRFITSRDTTILGDLYKYHPEYTGYKHIDFVDHYLFLKHLNDSLNLDLKFVGLDVIHKGYAKGTVQSLSRIMSEIQLDSIFSESIKVASELCEKRNLKFRDIKPWYEQLNKALAENKDVLKSHLSTEVQTALKNMMFSIQQSLEIYLDLTYRREVGIYRNYKRYIQPNEYAYVQYGKPHTYWERWKEWGNPGPSFLDMLQSDSLYFNRLLIVQYMIVSDKKDRSGEFYQPLTKTEFDEIKPVLEKNKFPQIVDFREMNGVNESFDFSIFFEE